MQNFSLTRSTGSFDGNINEFSAHSREQAASRDFRDVGLARRHWENESLPIARLIAPPLFQDDGVIPRSDGRTGMFGSCRETSTACSPAPRFDRCQVPSPGRLPMNDEKNFHGPLVFEEIPCPKAGTAQS